MDRNASARERRSTWVRFLEVSTPLRTFVHATAIDTSSRESNVDDPRLYCWLRCHDSGPGGRCMLRLYVKLWQIWPSNNNIFCDGICITGPQLGYFFLTSTLIGVLPSSSPIPRIL